MLDFIRAIPWERKAALWDAPVITNETVLAGIAERIADGRLPVYDCIETYPCSDFVHDRDSRPQFFVAKRSNGDRFLVNTEGYTYARYIAKLPAEAK